jgi:hypothetical protein
LAGERERRSIASLGADGGAPHKSILQGRYDALIGRMRSLYHAQCRFSAFFRHEIDIFPRSAEPLDGLGRKSEYPR